uniref:Thrombospondin-related anonymous protein n=2 Tax=Babesia gibsoni TaxID=33632 RepID=D3YC29_BABGI|nr:thrombospondin-related anonymous protein [Babesia gibsoni]
MARMKGVTLYTIFLLLSAKYVHGENEDGDGDEHRTRGDTFVPYSEEQEYKQESDWYKPGTSGNDQSDFEHMSREEILRKRKENKRDLELRYYIPTLNGDERGLENMLKYAKRVNHWLGVCVSAGKDYVIAVEDTTHFGEEFWKTELHSFVKLLAYGLSATKGTNTLSLVRYSNTVEKVLDRTLINRNNARKLGLVVDQLFDKKPTSRKAHPGAALKFMRENVYPNHDRFVRRGDTTTLSVENAAGKDTVVIMVNSGSVSDSALALEEALYARRNGVTIFSLDIGERSSGFWKQVVGCRAGHRCLKYMSALNQELLEKVGTMVRNLCEPDGRDAVCLEEWSEYTACSKPCGIGLKTSTLKGHKTLLTTTNGANGIKGRTCEEQLANIKTKQLLCNTKQCNRHPYPANTMHHSSHTDGLPSGANEYTAAYQNGDGDVVETVVEGKTDEEEPTGGDVSVPTTPAEPRHPKKEQYFPLNPDDTDIIDPYPGFNPTDEEEESDELGDEMGLTTNEDDEEEEEMEDQTLDEESHDEADDTEESVTDAHPHPRHTDLEDGIADALNEMDDYSHEDEYDHEADAEEEEEAEETEEEEEDEDDYSEDEDYEEPDYLDDRGNIITDDFHEGDYDMDARRGPYGIDYGRYNGEGLYEDQQENEYGGGNNMFDGKMPLFWEYKAYILAGFAGLLLITVVYYGSHIVRSNKQEEELNDETEYLQSGDGDDFEAGGREQVADANEAMWA